MYNEYGTSGEIKSIPKGNNISYQIRKFTLESNGVYVFSSISL